MLNIIRTGFVVVLLFISGCTSTPQTSRYYLLESLAKNAELNANQYIVLQPIELADYIKSLNLHIKAEDGEVIYSHSIGCNTMYWFALSSVFFARLSSK